MSMNRCLPVFGALLFLSTAVICAEGNLSDLKKSLDKAVKAAENEKIKTLASEIAKIGGEKAAELLFNVGLQVNVPDVYKTIAKELAGMTDEEALKFFERISEKNGPKDGNALIYLTDILALMKHSKAVELLSRLIAKNSDHVRLSSIQALVQLSRRESIPPLLNLLEQYEKKKDRGLVYQEALDALFDLTGEQFEVLEDWKNWWDANKNTFEPGKQDASGKTARVRKRSKDKTPEFVGKQIFSKNVIFVIDTSGTMMYVVKDDIPGLGVGDGSDAGNVSGGGHMTPEDARLAKFWTRMEMAKRELLKALAAFDAQAKINVLEFNTKVKELSKVLIPATPPNKKKASDWVKKMNFVENPGTDTLKALERAFSSDPSVTAIYFLSDGLPSKDGRKNDDPMPLLDKVEAFNRFFKIKVHTFGYDPISFAYGQENAELARANDFLKKLAAKTGGTFTLLKVTNEKPPPDFK
ncbi:MAG: hypothetical protein HY717_19090 [Planctomycetes bacterium]|nr:hypothetical protein [Planctomycetota bacterium]